MAERADMIRGEWDEDGFHLHVATDDDSHDIRITSVETARDLIGTVDQLREWVDEHDRQTEERRAVLGIAGDAGWPDALEHEVAELEEQ